MAGIHGQDQPALPPGLLLRREGRRDCFTLLGGQAKCGVEASDDAHDRGSFPIPDPPRQLIGVTFRDVRSNRLLNGLRHAGSDDRDGLDGLLDAWAWLLQPRKLHNRVLQARLAGSSDLHSLFFGQLAANLPRKLQLRY